MKFFKKHIAIISTSLFVMGLYAAPPSPGPGPSSPGGGNPPAPGPETPPDSRPPRPLPPSPKDPAHMLYYRGSRTAEENLPLTINQVKAKRVGPDLVDIEIVFNQSINPRSVKHSRITIDGLELSQTIRFWFNRKGDTVKFMLESKNDSLELGIKRVRAFDGSVISPVQMSVQVSEDAETTSGGKE